MKEYWDGGSADSITWRLNSREVREILHLRSEFADEDINSLELS